MREEQVQNAVKFLSHPKVRGSPVMYRRSFLEKKGLTKEEIDEAFRRVPVSELLIAIQANRRRQSFSCFTLFGCKLQDPSSSVQAPTANQGNKKLVLKWDFGLEFVHCLYK